MILLVGLGNCGDLYKNNRHNVGFMVIDSILESFKISNAKNKFHSVFYDFDFNGEKVILMKPLTLMNLSGKAVLEITNFYKISLENVIVFYDDMDLDLGKIR
jgi:PTH1 family peptidyl-tRNA hydrolase